MTPAPASPTDAQPAPNALAAPTDPALRRRHLLTGAAALVLGGAPPARAQARPTISFLSWSAALEPLKIHIEGFTAATGLGVFHQHLPWATYRAGVLNRLAAGSQPDVLWVADTHLAEFAAANAIAPIDDIPELTRFNAEALPFCTQTMTLEGRQYGLGYYTDHMAFIYNQNLLARAGIARPPETWDQLVQQAKAMQQQGVCKDPLALPLAADPWLIEIIVAVLASFGGMRPVARDLDGPGDSDRPMRNALTFLRDAMRHHGIMPANALDMTEADLFADFAEGDHAFTLLPSYRLMQLNDPRVSTAAGAFRVALMPNGADATGHFSQGWLRFYGMSAAAKADPARRAMATRFMAAFGGRDWTNTYRVQKAMLLDLGLPSCALPLAEDPAVRRFHARDAESALMLEQQRHRLRAKSIWAPWYGQWQVAMNEVWRETIAGRMEAADGVEISRVTWQGLQRMWRWTSP